MSRSTLWGRLILTATVISLAILLPRAAEACRGFCRYDPDDPFCSYCDVSSSYTGMLCYQDGCSCIEVQCVAAFTNVLGGPSDPHVPAGLSPTNCPAEPGASPAERPPAVPFAAPTPAPPNGDPGH